MTKLFEEYKEAIEDMLEQEIDEVTTVTDIEVRFILDGEPYKVPMSSVIEVVKSNRKLNEYFKKDPSEEYAKYAEQVKDIDDLIKNVIEKREILKRAIDLATSDNSSVYYKISLVKDFLTYADNKLARHGRLITL